MVMLMVMKPLLAFTNTRVTKAQLLTSLEAHRAADAIISGTYWEGNGHGKECAVGCSIHDFAPGKEDHHALYPELFGIPEGLARLEDHIFEGLPDGIRVDWPLRFTRAVPEGADLSGVMPRVLVRIIERRRVALDTLAISPALREQVGAAMDQTLVALRQWAETGVADVDAARSAAASAASAAWSAAASAAASAASAAYQWMADVLIEEIERCAPVAV